MYENANKLRKCILLDNIIRSGFPGVTVSDTIAIREICTRAERALDITVYSAVKIIADRLSAGKWVDRSDSDVLCPLAGFNYLTV